MTPAMVHVNCTLDVLPFAFDAAARTTYGLDAAALESIVPVIMPVDGLMLRAAGSGAAV